MAFKIVHTQRLKAVLLAIGLLGGAWPLRAEEEDVTLPDVVQSVQEWAQENLDTNFLNALPEIDDQKVREFFHNVQQRYAGDYVLDVGALKQAAAMVRPLLAGTEQMQPYAAWLKAQMDYLEVADALRTANPSLVTSTNQLSLQVTNPPPQMEREFWIKQVANRPWPPGAKEYVPQLKLIFAAQDVPSELVWLAEVESSFDRGAESPVGAAGLFQLMPATAKRFGLSLWPLDQRYQTKPSAIASAQYLKFLHDKFKDWRLALAAYNAGEGRVQKLLDRYHTHSYDVIATHLPAETQMYVPRVEAVIAQREGAKLEEL